MVFCACWTPYCPVYMRHCKEMESSLHIVMLIVLFWDLAVRFRTTSGLDSAVDTIQVKNVTFDHVKGVEEAKNELQEVVDFLKNPQKFTVLGGKLPKGNMIIFSHLMSLFLLSTKMALMQSEKIK